MSRRAASAAFALLALLTAPAAAQLDADFTADVTSGGAALTVTFTDASTGATPTVWQWLFGDGEFQATSSPQITHVYTEPGTYTVEMTALAFPDTDSETKTDLIVVVPPDLTPDFDASPSSGKTILGVLFTDQTTGTGAPSEWLWEFGDGGSSTDPGAFHFYDTPGSYDVTLTVSSAGESWSLTKPDAVVVLPAVYTPDFTPLPASGSVPLEVAFSNDTTGDTTTSQVWDFGDGTGSTDFAPTHTYDTPGSYTVTLTSFVGTQQESVTKRDVVSVNPVTLVPGMGAAPLAGPVPLQVAFQDTSAGVTPTAWSWDFGDGTTSTLQDPVHEYELPGEYSVRLEVSYFGQTEVLVMEDLITVGHLATLQVPADVATIQQAVDQAGPFTEIVVAPGVYAEAITLAGQPVTLTGAGGAVATTLDGSGLGVAQLTAPVDQPAGTRVRGFTLTGGGGVDGGAVRVQAGAQLVLEACRFVDNTTGGDGGALWAAASAEVLVEDCSFAGNHADGSGGAAYGSLSNLTTLRRCALSHNEAAGAGGGAYGVRLEDCVLRGNLAGTSGGGAAESSAFGSLFEGNTAAASGGGLVLNVYEPFIAIASVTGCTFRGNAAGSTGGGARLTASSDSIFGVSVIVSDCIFDGNDAPVSDGLHGDAVNGATTVQRCTFLDDDAVGGAAFTVRSSIFAAGAQPVPAALGSVTWSCVVGGFPGEGNIATDPLLVDPAAGAYGLLPGSPCIDSGWPFDFLDPDGSLVDMGALTLSATLDVGVPLSGALGLPSLRALGDLTPASALTLDFDRGPPLGTTNLVLGASGAALPFKGGTLSPSPDLIVAGLPLDVDGELALPTTWPGLPVGASIWLQAWAADGVGPAGWSATNGLVLLQL